MISGDLSALSAAAVARRSTGMSEIVSGHPVRLGCSGERCVYHEQSHGGRPRPSRSHPAAGQGTPQFRLAVSRPPGVRLGLRCWESECGLESVQFGDPGSGPTFGRSRLSGRRRVPRPATRQAASAGDCPADCSFLARWAAVPSTSQQASKQMRRRAKWQARGRLRSIQRLLLGAAVEGMTEGRTQPWESTKCHFFLGTIVALRSVCHQPSSGLVPVGGFLQTTVGRCLARSVPLAVPTCWTGMLIGGPR